MHFVLGAAGGLGHDGLMPSGFIHGVLTACRHQFSWPRRDDSGVHYQVCVHCGAKYSYDWTTMKRVAPLASEEELDARPARRKCGTKKAWVPRERRLRHRVAVRFRAAGSQEWLEGETENISRSGLLFRSAAAMEVGSGVELIFEMPYEVTGDDDARVVCQGSVVRMEEVPATRTRKQVSYLVACAIADSRFAAEGE